MVTHSATVRRGEERPAPEGRRERPSLGRVWLHAVRPHTLGASLVPVLVGAAFAAHVESFRAAVLAACALAALALQVTTNLANDAFDFLRAVDTEERVGPVRVTQAGWLRPRQVLAGVAVSVAVALGCGLWLVAVGGWPILMIGLISIAAALAYSAGPFPLASHGLGELAAFVFFGLVAVTGSAYLHTGELSRLAVLASIPVACLVSAIMVVNNLRDTASDARSGKRTLAVRLGPAHTRGLYGALVVTAELWCVLLALSFGTATLLLPLVTGPWAVQAIRAVQVARTAADFAGALAGTARLHAAYGALLCLALAL